MDEQGAINKDVKDTLSDHQKHLEIANREMGEVKRDIGWLRDWTKTMDMKLWGIMMAILTVLVKLFIR